MPDFIELAKEASSPECVFIDVPMSEKTTFRTGGNAAFFIAPATINELVDVIGVCEEKGVKFFVLGNGSNVLVKDGGFAGAVITTRGINKVELKEHGKIRAEAGALLSKTANFALDNDLAGLEFASGIPGTVGGAVYMNAGAYDRDIAGVFEKASALTVDGDIVELTNEEMNFSYRFSNAQKNGYIILDVVFTLKNSVYIDIKNEMLSLNKKREEKQPLNLPSAGSAFKRPQGNFAGKLIMEAGLSGFTIGGAQVSPKHCGFIVNIGGATAKDIISLVEHIQNTVFAEFSIALEPEFKIIGDD
ncbi:MAG: UDP-N-acetylmuramate dehydrogenase [Clostridiales bacterium]|nr:UDP-N-acetylmuramate dehydrogenase [Clostridiales bacterium]